MAGFREFMPGQVWFYFNPAATKELERKKELGSITSRPVVIIQQAFYPEWNDIITVCPMTSSDRRSGVYIDSTICKDGSLIEGGTVLPYLIYNIKAKFLYPMIATNHRRKLLSLAPEDFEKVRRGYLYHLGETVEEPEYVKNWKRLSGYDRNIIVHDIRLAVNEFEDLIYDGERGPGDHHPKIKKGPANPILIQQAPATNEIENHLIASLTEYDRESQKMYEPGEEFNSSRIGEQGNDHEDFVTQKEVRRDYQINFTQISVSDFSKQLSNTIGGIYPVSGTSMIFQGSKFLEGIEVKNMPDQLSRSDKFLMTTMTISDIVAKSGIQSKSTASRVRKSLREMDMSDIVEQIEAPEPFWYNTSMAANRSRSKKVLRRRMALLRYTKAEHMKFVKMDAESLAKAIPELPASYMKQLKCDIVMMYPSEKIQQDSGDTDKSKLIPEDADDASDSESVSETPPQSPEEPQKTYELWETLSPAEIREIRACDKRNIGSVAKNFSISKDKARQLRGYVLEMTGKVPCRKQPDIKDKNVEECCIRVIRAQSGVNSDDLLVFCRTDPSEIAKYFGTVKSANTPCKSDIRFMKATARTIIVK